MGRHKKHYSKATLNECIKSGYTTVASLAKLLRSCHTVISRELKRHGFPVSRGGGDRRQILSSSFLNTLVGIFGNNVSILADKLGYSRRILRRELKRHNIKTQGAGGQNISSLHDLEFDRLTVIRECGRQERHVVWLCACRCGNLTTATSSMLNAGLKRSCGCLLKERKGKWNRKWQHLISHKTAIIADRAAGISARNLALKYGCSETYFWRFLGASNV